MADMTKRQMLEAFRRLRRGRLASIMIAKQRLALDPVKALANDVKRDRERRTVTECERAIKEIDEAIYTLENDKVFPMPVEDYAIFEATWKGLGSLLRR